MLEAGTIWGFTSTTMASLMFCWSMYKQFVPYQLQGFLEKYVYKMIGLVSYSVNIKFTEYTEDKGLLKKSQAYDAIRNYLSSISTAGARRLKANELRNSRSFVFSLDDHETIQDVFQGVKVKWSSDVKESVNHHQSYTNDKSGPEKGRFLILSFHNRQREMITTTYLDHVLKIGKEIGLKKRERKLYTNNSLGLGSSFYSSADHGRWKSVPLNHPSTFETLAMDPEKKEALKKDLIKFTQGKDYYKKVGKSWKRGYLLYGPPGTGKSSMISAMANFLGYDVYDLELTKVRDNSELKSMLLDTREKSIILVEDIDCTVDFAAQRRSKKDEDDDSDDDSDTEANQMGLNRGRQCQVSLSGLLNAIDGLWSSCSGEKIIVFTTNFVDHLDPALIRRGRMDNHIEMSYCRFEAFKVLAKNYLDIESHDLYGEVKRLVEEVDMSPADVAENLMPKSDEDDADICLERLIKSLEEEKERAKTLAEEQKKKKAARYERKMAKEEKKKKKKKGKPRMECDVLDSESE